MKILGDLTLSEGSDVKNMTVAHGSVYPETPNKGEMFFHDTNGLSIHDGVKWYSIGAVSTDLNLVFNGGFTYYLGETDVTIITASQYKSNTTSLYVGGLRQTLDTDYTEVDDTTVKLLYPLTQPEIDGGLNFSLSWEPLTAAASNFVFNGTYTISYNVDGTATVTPQYQYESLSVYVGGVRLKPSIDYIENGNLSFTTLFPFSQNNINAGDNIVIDYAKL